MFGVIWTHENTASSPSCLQCASTTQHILPHQALLTLFPGMDMYKMNIIWKQWNILPRPPNMCLLLITLVHYSSTSKQNEWPRFRSLCIPPPLFPTHYSLRPWSMDICFIPLCKSPCVLQNRTEQNNTDSHIFSHCGLGFVCLSSASLPAGISQQSASYIRLGSALPGGFLSPVPWVVQI